MSDKAPEGMNIVTTAPGVLPRAPGQLSSNGVCEIGAKAFIPFEAYSANWMKPATATDFRKMEAWQKKQGDE